MIKLFFGRTNSPPLNPSEPAYGERLTIWILLVVLANTALWVSGERRQQLIDAIEVGTAHVEEWAEDEDLGEAQIRAAIQTQRDTLPFWTTLAMLGDFLVEPAWLMLRAFVATVVFASLAAIVGRPAEFGKAMAANATLQVFWAAGFVVRAALSGIVEGPAETSLALAAPSGDYRATTWLVLQQLDVYAVVGWLAIGCGAWWRNQANWFVAVLAIAVLVGVEISIRTSVLLMIGASMRLTIAAG